MTTKHFPKQDYTDQTDIIDEDDMEIQDFENFRSSSARGIKELALEQFKLCQINGSKEMHPEGTRRILVNGRVEQIVLPDTISAFINSVDMLDITLAPMKLKHKDKMREFEAELIYEQDRYKKFIEYYENKIKVMQMNRQEGSEGYNTVLAEYQQQRDMKRLEVKKVLLKYLSILINVCRYFDEATGVAV